MDVLIQVLAAQWRNGTFTERRYMKEHHAEGMECVEDENGLTVRYIYYETNSGRGPSRIKCCWVLRLTETQAKGVKQYLRAQMQNEDDEQLMLRYFQVLKDSWEAAMRKLNGLGVGICVWVLVAALINAAILIAEEKNPYSGLIQLLMPIRLWLAFGAGGAVFAISRIPHRKRKAALAFFRDGSAETICAKLQEMEE